MKNTTYIYIIVIIKILQIFRKIKVLKKNLKFESNWISNAQNFEVLEF